MVLSLISSIQLVPIGNNSGMINSNATSLNLLNEIN